MLFVVDAIVDVVDAIVDVVDVIIDVDDAIDDDVDAIFDVADGAGEILHKKFLDFYRQGNWDAALNLIKDLKRCWNEELNAYYKMMEERIQDLKFEEPWDWDGIYRATSK